MSIPPDDDIYAPPKSPVVEPDHASPGQLSPARRVFNIALAAVVSFLLPGFGQFFNRQWLKGGLMLAANSAVTFYASEFISLKMAVRLIAACDAGWNTWRRTRGGRWSD